MKSPSDALDYAGWHERVSDFRREDRVRKWCRASQSQARVILTIMSSVIRPIKCAPLPPRHSPPPNNFPLAADHPWIGFFIFWKKQPFFLTKGNHLTSHTTAALLPWGRALYKCCHVHMDLHSFAYSGEDLGGLRRRETIIRIHCVKKSISKLKILGHHSGG